MLAVPRSNGPERSCCGLSGMTSSPCGGQVTTAEAVLPRMGFWTWGGVASQRSGQAQRCTSGTVVDIAFWAPTMTLILIKRSCTRTSQHFPSNAPTALPR